MEEVQNPKDYCFKCEIPELFEKGEKSLEHCRRVCQNCKCFGRNGIYKFDVVINLRRHTGNLKPGKGKTATRKKQYGEAVANLTSEGKTVREIAKILGISPTTVIGIKKEVCNK